MPGEILKRDKLWLVPYGPTGDGTNSRDQTGKVPCWNGPLTAWVREYLGGSVELLRKISTSSYGRMEPELARAQPPEAGRAWERSTE